ncbi:MAG: hypothetical protein IPK96_09930 [Flammeovirgaceae bacterium]|nr:hypothetical protein [Flammeovirgaceae bacterium]
MRKFVLLLITGISFSVFGQEQVDSVKTTQLDEVVVKSQRLFDLERLPETKGTYLWAGKKNEVINIQSLNANISEKTGRQILLKFRACLFMIWMEWKPSKYFNSWIRSHRVGNLTSVETVSN